MAYYENFIYHILRRMKLNTEACDDLVQDILIKLWKKMGAYDAEKGSFRAWLGRVVRNAAYDYFDSVKSRRALMETLREMAETIRSAPASDLEKMIEEEWMLYMTSFAIRVTYLDRGRGQWSLEVSGENEKKIVRNSDSGEWKTLTVEIKELRDAELRLNYEGGDDTVFHRVEIEKAAQGLVTR